jgi:hypothetical protein
MMIIIFIYRQYVLTFNRNEIILKSLLIFDKSHLIEVI